MNLNLLMERGVTDIMKTVGRYYLDNKQGRAFLARTLPRIKKSAALRERNEAKGTHIPPFLIASVASQCNLHCAGCYARSGGACSDTHAKPDLDAQEWDRVFGEASDVGVSFVLIAGGEPLMRHDVLRVAGRHTGMIFPVFTNGTMFDEDYLALFESNRNLIPVVSIEGGEKETDARRGAGTYRTIEAAMARFRERKMLFGASITVSRINRDTVLSETFIAGLHERGCGLVVFVEYVPTEAGTDHLALDSQDLKVMESAVETCRSTFRDMVILSFPGDETAMGGCLASGRGFFHINPQGGAEPCPFSPFAKHNVRQSSIEQILHSDYFDDIRTIAVQAGPHTGGCVLFKYENQVQALLAR